MKFSFFMVDSRDVRSRTLAFVMTTWAIMTLRFVVGGLEVTWGAVSLGDPAERDSRLWIGDGGHFGGLGRARLEPRQKIRGTKPWVADSCKLSF